MFWGKTAPLYDIYEYLYNGKVIRAMCKTVTALIAPTDMVLECACGTGIISKPVARKCKRLIATDCSVGMLRQARRKCPQKKNAKCSNISFKKVDILRLPFKDNCFDKVIAGNVIHLLDAPQTALAELERVCKKGGKMIIPTYLNQKSGGVTSCAAKLLEMVGADFKRQFSFQNYQDFFENMGYTDVKYTLLDGRMPCAVAVIVKK